jgi:hypothetical protein
MQVTAEVHRALKQAPYFGPQGMGVSPAFTGFEVRCLFALDMCAIGALRDHSQGRSTLCHHISKTLCAAAGTAEQLPDGAMPGPLCHSRRSHRPGTCSHLQPLRSASQGTGSTASLSQ